MANYISDRELRKLQRERRKEEIERERERLTGEMEEREQMETMNMEDYRQELFRIRQERKEMKIQQELDRQKYEDQRIRLDEIERRKHEEREDRMRRLEEIERRNDEEKRKLEEYQMKKLEEDRLREIQRTLEENRRQETDRQKTKDDLAIKEKLDQLMLEEMQMQREIEEEDEEVFENFDMEQEKLEKRLRRQSETALEHLKTRNTSLEREVKQLHKTWTPDGYWKQHHGTFDRSRDGSEDELEAEWTTIDKYEKTGYETDDEIERHRENIEKLKLKEQVLMNELTTKRNCKKDREEKRRQKEYQRKLEKQRTLQQLKEEQQRLVAELKKHEDTINALSSSASESEGDYSSHKRNKMLRQRSTSPGHIEPTTEGHKFLIPKVPHLTEENFEEWKTEIEVMIDSNLYQRYALLHAVRNTLSKASKRLRSVLPTIDPKATTEEILDKLETIFGNRRSGESHLADFYKAKQMKDENVAEWGVRFETIVLKAEKKGQINRVQKEQMLMKRFWKYLYDDRLKLSTRIFYEKSSSFEELLKEIRVEEREMNTNSDSSDKESRKSGQNVDRLIKRINTIRKSDNTRTGYREAERDETTDRWHGHFQRGRTRYRWQDNRGFGRGYRGRDYGYDTYDMRNRRDFDSTLT